MRATDAAGNAAVQPLEAAWSVAYPPRQPYVRLAAGAVGPAGNATDAFALEVTRLPTRCAPAAQTYGCYPNPLNIT